MYQYIIDILCKGESNITIEKAIIHKKRTITIPIDILAKNCSTSFQRHYN